MDIFGYAYLEGFEPTRNRFLVVEAKKDAATVEVVDQVMKYVDWVRDEYAEETIQQSKRSLLPPASLRQSLTMPLRGDDASTRSVGGRRR